MKGLGAVRQPDELYNPPDHMITLGVSTVSTAQDLPEGTGIIRLTGLTTADATLNFYVNIGTTLAAVPSTGASTGSTAISHPVQGQAMFRCPGSTEISIICRDSSGFVHVECWQY